MTEQTDRKKHWVTALALLGLMTLGGAVHYVNRNYDLRLVRVDGDGPGRDTAAGSQDGNNPAYAAQSGRPAPIVVRLACARTASAMSALRSPSRSLRQQLRQADPRAPAPLPNKRCKPSADL